MPFVIDASVSLGWVLKDETNPYADMVLEQVRREQGFVAPHWAMEVANGLLVAARRARITEADIAMAVGLLNSLPIVEHGLRPDVVFGPIRDLARSQSLTVYHAAYLHIAMIEGLPIATQDNALRTAASRVGVLLLDRS